MSRLAGLGIAATSVLLLASPATAVRRSPVSVHTSIVIVTAGKPTEYQFRVTPKTVRPGTVIFKITNLGKKPHTFGINGQTSKVLRPHASTTLRVVFKKPSRYIYTDRCVENPNGQEQDEA